MGQTTFTAKPQKAGPMPVRKVLVLLVIFVLCVGAGYAFIRRQQWIESQRNLYQEYLGFNDWRPRIKPRYDSAFSLVNEAERIQLDHPDLAAAARLESELRRELKVVEALPNGKFDMHGGWHAFPQELSNMLTSHVDYLANIRSLNSSPSDSKVRMQQAFLGAERDDQTAKDLRALPAVQVLINRNAMLGDSALRAKATLTVKSNYESMRKTTSQLEQVIDEPEFVPPGLDLEFARKLADK